MKWKGSDNPLRKTIEKTAGNRRHLKINSGRARFLFAQNALQPPRQQNRGYYRRITKLTC